MLPDGAAQLVEQLSSMDPIELPPNPGLLACGIEKSVSFQLELHQTRKVRDQALKRSQAFAISARHLKGKGCLKLFLRLLPSPQLDLACGQHDPHQCLCALVSGLDPEGEALASKDSRILKSPGLKKNP